MATSKSKADTVEPEEMVTPGRWRELAPGKVAWEPGDSSEICPQHEVVKIHHTSTGWTCEHKTVIFQNPLTTKPEGTQQVQAVTSGDLRQQIAALVAQAEAMESAEGVR